MEWLPLHLLSNAGDGMQRDQTKAIWAWSMYDWANSAFATTVIAGFFPIFFKEFWSTGVDPTISTARLGIANSIEGIIVAVLAPVLGAIADKGSAKKKFLLFFVGLGVMMTSALYLVAQGQWPLAAGLFVLGNLGFSGGNVFYDALITGVASEKKLNLVSALGYSMGYLGGGVLFAVNVWMMLRPAAFGFADVSAAVRFAFLLVGIWWAVFSVPIFLFVKEPENAEAAAVSGLKAVRAGLAQLNQTFQEIRRLKNIMLFLAAYWLYIDGVDTVIRMAVDYGMSLGFDTNGLIVALLITQFVGFPAALGFGFLGNKIGAKRAIFFAIAVYLGVSIWGAFMHTKAEFYLLAVVIGLVQGGLQALSRSFFAKIIPEEKSAQYFGFYNMLGKFAAVLGPGLMGVVGLIVKTLGYSSQAASRVGISSLSLLFIAGGLLFSRVKEEK